MQITRVRVSRLERTLQHPTPFWDDEPESDYPLPVGTGEYRIAAVFIEVDTDAGITGLGGPIEEDEGRFVTQHLAPHIVGVDPCATEDIWHRLYRSQIRRPDRSTMSALAALDFALWDLKGKWANAPVYRLLGGPTCPAIPAYISADGYSLRPELVRQRATEFLQQGYRAMKWFFREGPRTGPEDMEADITLARTLRETVGDDIEIMLDAVSSWDIPYTRAMIERLTDYQPAWLEDPITGTAEDYATLRSQSSIPIAAGYNRYTRRDLKHLLDAQGVDVLQPDIVYVGGITEALKVCAIASTYNVRVIPHVESVPATMHVLAAQPADLCPILEYLPKWQAIHQGFFKEPIAPVNAVIHLTEKAGLGIELDETKIRTRQALN